MLEHATVNKDFHQPNLYHFKDIDLLYIQSLDADCPVYLREALNYLRLYQALARSMRKLAIPTHERWFDGHTLRDAAPSLVGAVENVAEFDPALTSSMLILGKLKALRERTTPMKYFNSAFARLDDATRRVFDHDCGATTYVDQTTLEKHAGTICARRKSLPVLQRVGGSRWRGSRCLVLMSCESHYLQVYLPYWLSVAEYLKQLGLSYHIIITDGQTTTQQLVDDAETLRRSIGAFRGYDTDSYADNVSFSHVDVPQWCASRRTFAACARYLYARSLLEEAGTPVLVQDIDLYVVEKPTAWIDALPVDRVVLVSNSVRSTIDPWRMFLGGTVVFPQMDELGHSLHSLLHWLEDYLLHNLAVEDCWYLDQNALNYIHDRSMSEGGLMANLLYSHAAMRHPKRPTQGPPINTLFQEQQLASGT